MRLYREGDKSVAVCDVDRRKVTTVMERRDFQPDGCSEPIPGLLVAVCESCGTVLTIPAQSCVRINILRKSGRKMGKAFDARVSAELLDALYLVASEVGGSLPAAQSGVLRYYIGQAAKSPEFAAHLAERAATSPVAKPGPGRFSVRVEPAQFLQALRAAKAVGLKNKGELIRGAAAVAIDDFAVSYSDPAGRIISPKPDAVGRYRRDVLKEAGKHFGF